MKSKHMIPAMLLGVSCNAFSQNMPPGPPPNPVVIALDRDGDHEISKREIRNAADSLAKLDEDQAMVPSVRKNCARNHPEENAATKGMMPTTRINALPDRNRRSSLRLMRMVMAAFP